MIYEDNSLYVDIRQFKHKLNSPNKRIRLYLGVYRAEEFERTVESIKLLPEDEQERVRNYIKSIF